MRVDRSVTTPLKGAPLSNAGTAVLNAARGRLAIRRQLATTPGRLRTACTLLAVGAIVFGFVAAHAAGERAQAVQSVRMTEPLLVSAVDLSASLSDAHKVAAFSFLAGGPEPATTRRRYAQALQKAGAGVAKLAGEIGTSSRGDTGVRQITQKLPIYAGFIGNARANNRQGFPVGNAYLRRASTTMRDEILIAARDLYKIQAQGLTKSYRAGVAMSTVAAVLAAGGAMLVVLLAAQVYIARATHRIVNPHLALATTVLLGLVAWIVVALALQQRDLVRAQRVGSDPVELLTATRILASRAQANESIALAARGGGEGEPRLGTVDTGFQAVIAPIGIARPGPAIGSRGLLDEAAVNAGRAPGATGAIDRIYGAYRAYREAHDRVVKWEKQGNFTKAVKLAVGGDAARPAPTRDAAGLPSCVRRGSAGPMSTRAAADALNCLLMEEVRHARGRFADAASGAGGALRGLPAGIPLLTALCALLALFGVRQRLKEYR
ncbi:MAG TPA: hypothetical protein VF526_09000 [Solirubrobacteraceae bacterium]